MAMRMQLTDAAIRTALKQLPPAGDRVTVRDADLGGFMLRVSQSRKATFAYEYRPRGAGRAVSATMLTFGTWPALKADKARKIAMGFMVDVSRGDDPAAAARARKAQATAETLGDLLAEGGVYERALRRRQLVNWKVALSSLRRELKPLMAREPKELSRKDLARCITALEDAGKPGAAADLRKFAYSFWDWCVQHDYTTFNPLSGWKRPPQTRAQRLAKEPVGRALDDREILALWQAADTEGAPFGALLQLGLFTGLRRGELAGLKWSDIGSDRITLEARSTKTGRKHEVHLTKPMREVIAAVPKTTSKLVFTFGGGRLKGWTRMVKRLQQASGVDFTLHDLRRTCRTLMSRLDIRDDIAELAIGHARADLVARYNRDEAWQHRVDAFEAVSDHIAALIGQPADAGKIVAMPGRQ